MSYSGPSTWDLSGDVPLNPSACYQAILARDSRFDGRFFTGVRSTGIFCRPICPARPPKLENCEFFPNAALAQWAGYRPCLRCRPELSPRLFQNVGTEVTVTRALRHIASGFLDTSSVRELAAKLGVSDRRLRQLFATHVGTSPTQVAQTRRLLFAKQLAHETDLSLTELAIAAGFNSIRRFNDAVQQAYGHPPSQWRRRKTQPQTGLRLRLTYSSPYSWSALMAYWQPRAMAGVEAVGESYCRVIDLGNQTGWVRVQPASGNVLAADIHLPEVHQLGTVVERLRRLFDLDADWGAIAAHLSQDPTLSPLLDCAPGFRLPGAWNPFELAVRVILGQQVSVAAATTVCNRLIARYGKPLSGLEVPAELTHQFPSPAVLATADLGAIGITRTRARAIQSLSSQVLAQPEFFEGLTTLEQAIEELCALPGIGPWTANYIALRGLQMPDAFPASDLGLLRAASPGESLTPAQLTQRAERWRPWRGYAALYLWAFGNQHPKSEALSA